MEADRALRGFSREVRCNIVNAKRHENFLLGYSRFSAGHEKTHPAIWQRVGSERLLNFTSLLSDRHPHGAAATAAAHTHAG
jgi:hypothetical protein